MHFSTLITLLPLLVTSFTSAIPAPLPAPTPIQVGVAGGVKIPPIAPVKILPGVLPIGAIVSASASAAISIGVKVDGAGVSAGVSIKDDVKASIAVYSPQPSGGPGGVDNRDFLTKLIQDILGLRFVNLALTVQSTDSIASGLQLNYNSIFNAIKTPGDYQNTLTSLNSLLKALNIYVDNLPASAKNDQAVKLSLARIDDVLSLYLTGLKAKATVLKINFAESLLKSGLNLGSISDVFKKLRTGASGVTVAGVKVL